MKIILNTLLIILFFSSTLFSQIKFDDDFDSGSIAGYTTMDSTTYYVTTNEDIGGRWFYFRMSGIKNRNLRVNITSDFSRAMYSYDNKEWNRFSASESPAKSIFVKTFSEDTVFTAYYTPYSFKYLKERIEKWKLNEFVTFDTIGFTDRNFPICELHITDKSIPDNEKFNVWIHSRAHPSETPASYHFDGIIRELLSNKEVIKHYLKKINFYCIPFINPEGVFFGKSRTNYDGIDVESNWDKSENETSTEVKILKNRMNEINDNKVFSVFLNLHSQASPYCTFWIHTASSTSSYFYRRQYQFSNLNTSDTPYFSQSDYRESNLKSVFPEGWLWNDHGDKVLALTYETPYDQYSNKTWVTNENLFEIGSRTVYAIAEFLGISHPEHIILDNKNAVVSGNWSSSVSGLYFYDEDYLTIDAGFGNNTVTFETETLKPGNYDVFGWWQQSNDFASNTNFKIITTDQEISFQKTQKLNGGQWNYFTNVELKNSGRIKIIVDDNALSGKVAVDAFRIIFRGTATKITNDNIKLKSFRLYQNFPNPFNPSTKIRFELEKNSKVKLEIFNSIGEKLATLIDSELNSGTHDILFNIAEFDTPSSGVYIYRLSTPQNSESKQMILLK